MRKKTKQSLDVASVADAWEALFSSQKSLSKSDLRKDGWIDIYELSTRLCCGRIAAISKMKKVGAEHKKFSVLWDDGKVRSVNFFRIK